ncbi:MAG: MFS transporter [Chloroflexi bacterium]|nr:MFS transporter [Chloroflexota bacterium]MCL5076376.1 MFS transporter [Chloroflexota bacterium]
MSGLLYLEGVLHIFVPLHTKLREAVRNGVAIKKLAFSDYISISIYWFALAFLWNSLHPIILPIRVLDFAPQALQGTYLGMMTFSGLMLAMLVQPLVGAISDHTTSSWGRRRPYVFLGTLLDLLFLTAVVISGNYWFLFVSYLLLQLSSNTAHGAYQGLIPDLVPPQRRGIAVGVKNLAEMVGTIAAVKVASFFIDQGQVWLAVVSIMAVLLGTMLVTVLTVQEEPLPATAKVPLLPTIRDTFKVDIRRYPDFVWLLVSRFFILISATAVQSFFLYFIKDVLQVPNPASVTADLMIVVVISLLVIVYPAGYLADRLGCKFLLVISGVGGMVAMLLMLLAHDYSYVLACGGIFGSSLGIFLTANWALIIKLIPLGESARYLGISNIATAGAAALSRLAGPLIDFFNAQQPNQGYTVLFLGGAICFLIGTILLVKVREVRASESSGLWGR